MPFANRLSLKACQSIQRKLLTGAWTIGGVIFEQSVAVELGGEETIMEGQGM